MKTIKSIECKSLLIVGMLASTILFANGAGDDLAKQLRILGFSEEEIKEELKKQLQKGGQQPPAVKSKAAQELLKHPEFKKALEAAPELGKLLEELDKHAPAAAKKQSSEITNQITDPFIKGKICKLLGIPFGEFAPPVKLTEENLLKIEVLNLHNDKLTDAGIEDLAKLQNLLVLNLEATNITDKGIKELVKLQKLKSLNVSRCKITDAGVKDLAKLQNLERLDLYGTRRVTDACLRDLAKLQKLKSLNLQLSEVTLEGTRKLRQALPKAEIQW